MLAEEMPLAHDSIKIMKYLTGGPAQLTYTQLRCDIPIPSSACHLKQKALREGLPLSRLAATAEHEKEITLVIKTAERSIMGIFNI